jgi:glycosyltransferase involved in cell wall biosynthesis/tetratricopeptide (TPR) repeat protein
MTKISCALIVRDDAATLDACLASIRPHVDELVIIDTGSIDGSPAIARRYADTFEVWLECNDEDGRIADFAAARNRSFDLCSHDWVCWFDGDDVVQNGENLRKLAESAEADNQLFLLPYEYGHDAAGNVVCLQRRERLMRPRSAFRWVSPVHEICMLQEPAKGSVAAVESDLVTVVHRKQLSVKAPDPDRNLRILRRHVEASGETDVRALYYLGTEYAAKGNAPMSLHWLKRYVELATWDDEKCKALLEVSRHYAHTGDHREAIRWAQDAILTRAWPEPYFALGKSFYALAMMGERPDYNFRRAAFWIEAGLKLPTDVLLYANPMERYEIQVWLHVCLKQLGDLDGAIASCETGLQALPDNGDLAFNLKQLKSEKSKRGLLSAIGDAFGYGVISEAQAALMRAAMSGDLRLEMEAPGPEAYVHRQADFNSAYATGTFPADGKLRIVLFVGHGVEPWNPDTFARTGLGGSETMAWEMARRLAKLGHAVRVFGHCTPSMEGEYEGVTFLDESRFHDITCDVLISSRRPDAVDDSRGCKAGARVLWVHDVHCGDAFTQERDLRFDRILCLSNWHREFFLSCYPTIDPAKVLVTRNGIDLSRFDGSEPRNPHRAIYSSSPDRGLLTALECWPRIREQVPDAELHVFYGFGNWETCARAVGDEGALKNIAHLKHLLATTPGVIFRDRVSQSELAREFMRAGVWAYSTWFSETSCITAMEAQAAGLYIVTSPVAALRETCPGAEFIGGDWRSREYADKFVQMVVAGMNHALTAQQRGDLRGRARASFGLDSLAEDWDRMLLDIHADVTERVVPAFREAAE